jgi:uncharacterized protein (DUF433 family)
MAKLWRGAFVTIAYGSPSTVNSQSISVMMSCGETTMIAGRKMAADLIQDRGRGPEIVGTRITIHNLLSDFLDATATEASICRLYDLTAEQVAAARAYVLNNLDTVLAEHLRIEARLSAGNPQEVIEKAKQTHADFMRFKEWLVQRQKAAAQEPLAETTSGSTPNASNGFPTFREWVAERESRSVKGS